MSSGLDPQHIHPSVDSVDIEYREIAWPLGFDVPLGWGSQRF